MKAIIVGAGIGGLTAALALLRKGIDVDVYERAAELTEAGAGLRCSPNGSRVLIELGLGEQMMASSVIPKQCAVRLWDTGRMWPLRNHGVAAARSDGAPDLLMYRGDLHTMLANAVRAEKLDAIHAWANCVDTVQDGDRVSALLHDGSTVSADVLIAADGVHSSVRRRLFGADRPGFTGMVAWRGVVPAERLPHVAPDTSTTWIGPGRSVAIAGVRGGKLIDFVGLTTTETWQAESWMESGSPADLRADFAGWHEDVLEIIRAIEAPYKWGLFVHEPSVQWSSGRVALLGDACHAMLPFLGQGANSAIEDGMVLSRCLTEATGVEAALRAYEGARSQRTAKIARRSAERGEHVRSRTLADPESAARYVEAEWSAESMSARYDWIFEYNAMETPV